MRTSPLCDFVPQIHLSQRSLWPSCINDQTWSVITFEIQCGMAVCCSPNTWRIWIHHVHLYQTSICHPAVQEKCHEKPTWWIKSFHIDRLYPLVILHNYGKPPFLIGKPSISMCHFPWLMLNNQRVYTKPFTRPLWHYLRPSPQKSKWFKWLATFPGLGEIPVAIFV